MPIVVNGTTIEDVKVNSNAIYEIKVNNETVWYKKLEALPIAQLVALDLGGKKVDKSSILTTRLAKVWNYTHSGTAYDKTHDIATPLGTTVPTLFGATKYVSNIMFSFGEESGGGVINYMNHHIPSSSIPIQGAINSIVKNHADKQAIEIGVSHINNQLKNIDKYTANVDGFSGDTAGRFIQMILPNKWEAFDLNLNQSGSTILNSGEMMLFSIGHSVDSDETSDAYLASYGEGHWYDGVVYGLYINKTENSQSVSWVDVTSRLFRPKVVSAKIRQFATE
jgi:hypothetical protein